MAEKSNVLKWVEGLVHRATLGEIPFTISEGTEGIHDCVDLTFVSEKDLMTESLCYHPTLILFYKPLPDAVEDPDYGLPAACKETGEFDFIYSYTENGFGEGLYLDHQNHAELFETICSLVKKGL